MCCVKKEGEKREELLARREDSIWQAALGKHSLCRDHPSSCNPLDCAQFIWGVRLSFA